MQPISNCDCWRKVLDFADTELPKQGWHQIEVAEAVASLLALGSTNKAIRHLVVDFYETDK